MELEKDINILPYGDRALLINFKQEISPAINGQVVTLSNQLKHANIKGVQFVQLAYCSITVGFDCGIINFNLLKELIVILHKEKKNQKSDFRKNKWRIPVCYEDEFSLDKIELEKQLNISFEKIIELHTSVEFQVYMLGFLPGFPYLGELPKGLYCQRKLNPRKYVPAQSVALAGKQAGIYPVASPGGWQIIGRTPVDIFNPLGEHVFLFSAGDTVRFFSISKKEYLEMENMEWGNFLEL